MTRDPEVIRKAIVATQQLIELELQKIETLRQLERSLQIAALHPGVFEGGKVRTSVEGKMTYSSYLGDIPTKETEFVIRPEKGEEVRIPLFQVPMELWPAKMPSALKRMHPNMYARIISQSVKESE